jgi:dihydroxyacetone kinase
MNEENLSMMAEVASLYYEQGYSQKEIAEKLFYSRSKVSRLLRKAIELKVVEVKIRYPITYIKGEEERLKDKYGLEDVVVVKHFMEMSNSASISKLGIAAAEYLDSYFKDGMTIGFYWGNTLANIANSISPTNKKNLTFVQMVGASRSSYVQIDSNKIVSTFMEAYKASCKLLHSPMIVKNKIARDTLKSEDIIKHTLQKGKECDLIVCGIGNLRGTGKISTLEGYATEEDRQILLKQNAVGIIAGEFIDMDGNFISNDLSDSIIGVRITELSEKTKKLVVAGGIDKSIVLKSSLKKGLITHLITDDLNSHKL